MGRRRDRFLWLLRRSTRSVSPDQVHATPRAVDKGANVQTTRVVSLDDTFELASLQGMYKNTFYMH